MDAIKGIGPYFIVQASSPLGEFLARLDQHTHDLPRVLASLAAWLDGYGAQAAGTKAAAPAPAGKKT